MTVIGLVVWFACVWQYFTYFDLCSNCFISAGKGHIWKLVLFICVAMSSLGQAIPIVRFCLWSVCVPVHRYSFFVLVTLYQLLRESMRMGTTNSYNQ